MSELPGRHADGRWLPGCAGNPGGRHKSFPELRALARQHTEEAIAALVRVIYEGDHRAVVQAVTLLLAYAHGRPAQTINVRDIKSLSDLTNDEIRALMQDPLVINGEIEEEEVVEVSDE